MGSYLCPQEYKLVMMGPGGVGKSAMTIQYIQNHFVDEYDPTIEDSYRKQIELDGEVKLLDILDTAGQDEYWAMSESYIRCGQGFLVGMILFSITSRDSFSEVQTFIHKIERIKDMDCDIIPMLLIGNKKDLEEDRQVTHDEGQQLATENGIEYLETDNIEEAFHQLVRSIDLNSDVRVRTKAKMFGLPLPFSERTYNRPVPVPKAPPTSVPDKTDEINRSACALLSTTAFHDVHFLCSDGEHVTAHAFVLEARCNKLGKMIGRQLKKEGRSASLVCPAEPVTLDVPFSAPCMTKVIKLLYQEQSGTLSFGDIHLHHVDAAIHGFGMSDWLEACDWLQAEGGHELAERESRLIQSQEFKEASKPVFKERTCRFVTDEEIEAMKHPKHFQTDLYIRPLDTVLSKNSHSYYHNQNPSASTYEREYAMRKKTYDIVLIAGDSSSERTVATRRLSLSDRPIYAHRAILAVRSPHFEAMFSSGLAESQLEHRQTLTIPGVNRAALKALVKYLYTGDLDVEQDLAIAYDVLALMDLQCMQDQRLKALCEQALIKIINNQTLANLLCAAFYTSATQLQAACLHAAAYTEHEAFRQALSDPDSALAQVPDSGAGVTCSNMCNSLVGEKLTPELMKNVEKRHAQFTMKQRNWEKRIKNSRFERLPDKLPWYRHVLPSYQQYW